MPYSLAPRGRSFTGDHIYDIDDKSPICRCQLERVTQIVKCVPGPELVLGRQFAIFNPIICYVCGDDFDLIRVWKINTALGRTLDGHDKRVTDMAFFSEDVPLLASASGNGRVCILKISEEEDEDDKPQITSQIVIAIQIVGEGESVHPRVCWHCHKQEILFVGMGTRVLKIDTTKVGKGELFSEGEPLRCPVDRLVDSVQLVGTHDGEVTDLSMFPLKTTFLVSASVDGTGLLNREVKIWSSASDAESWRCTQTLVLTSSAATRVQEAFFNQVVVFSQAGLLLLANAKKNAIYAVHLEYGLNPVAIRMDYIAEFAVTTSIFSFIGTRDLPHKHCVQLYCLQNKSIEQYALDLSQCLPQLDNVVSVFENPEPSQEHVAAKNPDDLWMILQNESAKREELLRDHTQHMTDKISNCLKEDVPTLVGHIVTPRIEIQEALYPAIFEAFQRVQVDLRGQVGNIVKEKSNAIARRVNR